MRVFSRSFQTPKRKFNVIFRHCNLQGDATTEVLLNLLGRTMTLGVEFQDNWYLVPQVLFQPYPWTLRSDFPSRARQGWKTFCNSRKSRWNLFRWFFYRK